MNVFIALKGELISDFILVQVKENLKGELISDFILVQVKENPTLVFSGERKIPTRGSTVPVGNEACPVSYWNGGPEGWDFPFRTEHQ